MTLEVIKSCKLCGNQHLDDHISSTDFFGTNENFDIQRCKACNTLYTNPRPDENSIVTYYKSASYVSHGDSVNPLFDKLYSFIQARNFRYKLQILKKYTLTQKHLDFGCGQASFLAFLKQRQWQVTGVEPDDVARNRATQKLQQGVYTNLHEIAHQTFSSISLFHVLEHVHSLEETFKQLIQLLDQNGIILLALPNFEAQDAHYYGKYWAGYDVPRHLYHFSQKSMHQLSKRFGLNIVATHPMKFDSYYVSLLSEQYLTGKKQYVKAFLRGYNSNRNARKTGEYSSLIYVLSK